MTVVEAERKLGKMRMNAKKRNNEREGERAKKELRKSENKTTVP